MFVYYDNVYIEEFLYFWTGNVFTVYNSEGDIHLEVTMAMTAVNISSESFMDDIIGVHILNGST